MIFFRRMLKSSVAICIIYTFLFTLIIYSASSYSVKKEYANTVMSKLDHISTNINDRLTRTQELSESLRKNDAVITANTSDNDIYATTRVYSFLNSLMASYTNPFYMIAIAKISDDLIISNFATMSVARYCSEYLNVTNEDFNAVIQEFEQDPLHSGVPIVSQIPTESGTEDLITIVTCERTGMKEPLYVFASFSMDNIIQGAEMENSTLIIGLDNKPIYANGNFALSELDGILNGNVPRGYTLFRAENPNSSLLRNLQPYFLVPKKQYIALLSRLTLLTLAICIMILISSYFLAYYITKKTYLPIRGLLSALGVKNVSTKENEINKIESIITDVKTNNLHLQQLVNTYQISLEDRFIRGLLFGQLEPAEIKQGLSDFQFTNIKTSFITVIIEYADYDTLLQTLSKDSITLVKQTIFSVLDKGLAEMDYHWVLDLSTDRYIIVSTVPDPKEFTILLKHLLNQIETSLEIELFAAMGSVVPAITEIDRSYMDALYVSQHRVLGLQHAIICTPEEIHALKTDLPFYPVEIENSIVVETTRGNQKEAERLYTQLLKQNFPDHTFSAEQMSQFILMLVSTFNRILAALNKQPDEIFPPNTIIFLELKSCKTVSELKEKILELTYTITENVNTQKQSINEKNAKLIRLYIEENYTKDISLADLAEYLNVSQEHASRVFKKLLNDNFKNYLSHFRYLKAKEIMSASPTMKLKDVASAVGCANTGILSRLFQKYDGISAAEYLKRM
ncbi:helix-turn-helix domain-containing protein [Ructibacterium gallinarum]|uniref:Helix-turn-helix domain-containing protein n=1 Tax=Ructibacterium gallinarum TaxID=2779355 RepID=A0A9D5R9K3_9FIRM|nr:helix-turn-helix domain-containing protein [Ructibacterium gallinarum]MBE5041170.1 helix-turn-helix domain-containing protein [Ructibacterium gallinarum]